MLGCSIDLTAFGRSVLSCGEEIAILWAGIWGVRAIAVELVAPPHHLPRVAPNSSHRNALAYRAQGPGM